MILSLWCAENGAHELVVVDLDPAVAVAVEPLEGLGEGLDDDARAHEAVERNPRRGSVTCARAGACKVYPSRGDAVNACSCSGGT